MSRRAAGSPTRVASTPDRSAFATAGGTLLVALLAGCWTPEVSKESADAQVYGLLSQTSAAVTGQAKTTPIERPVDTLRQRLVASSADGPPVQLSLLDALDVAAENSRDFQRQKEQLYLAGLNLTGVLWDFDLQWDGGGSADVDGRSDETADVTLADDLRASVSTVAGTRVVGSFANEFLRSIVNGGTFDGSSLLNLTLTQPLLRRFGYRIVREPLTQAERDLVYAVRAYERFRSTFAVRVVSEYWEIARQMADLANVDANYKNRVDARTQTEQLFNANRKTITDLGRDRQSEYLADAQRVTALNRLQTQLDRFKLTLGLPVTARIELDRGELARVTGQGVTPIELDEDHAIELAVDRRYDFRTVVDQVGDSGRRILVAEDALGMALDFTAALDVPSADGNTLNPDWSRVNWRAGFDLDLALNRINERNAYRSALISFAVAVRAREQSEDQIAADVRSSLRDLRTAIDTFRIQSLAVQLAEQRVEATMDLYAAGRIQALERQAAQDDLLQAQLDRNASIVDYALARLRLMNNLEAISFEPQGLRFDPALPLPEPRSAE